MRTNLHHYYINTDKPEGREAYTALRAQLKISHNGKCFNVWADTKTSRDRQNKIEEVELDPAFLFNNQWNELGNGARRLFDWYEGIYPNKKIKEGHWLEITPEMEAIRQHTQRLLGRTAIHFVAVTRHPCRPVEATEGLIIESELDLQCDLVELLQPLTVRGVRGAARSQQRDEQHEVDELHIDHGRSETFMQLATTSVEHHGATY